MGVVASREITRIENTELFFRKVLAGEEIIRTDKDGKKNLITKNGTIYLNDNYSIRVYSFINKNTGELMLNIALDIKTLDDRKRIKEAMAKKETNKGGSEDLF